MAFHHPSYVATHPELVQRARSLAPLLRERAPRVEDERAVSTDTIAKLREAGLLRLMQPKRFGGYELGLDAVIDVSSELAKACGSTGWLSVILNTGWLVGAFDLRAQEDVWGNNPQAIVSATYQGPATLDKVQGGYRISGKWPFASGIDHAQWHIVGALVMGGDVPEFKLFLVPRAELTIEDDWHTTGLRGTGSRTVVLRDVLVPEHRIVSFGSVREGDSPGGKLHDNPLFRIPIAAFAIGTVGVQLGIAEGAYEWALEYLRDNVKYGRPARDRPATQAVLGEVRSQLDAVNVLARHDADELWARASAREKLPLEARSRYHLHSAYITRVTIAAVDKLHEGVGGSAIYERNPIERMWRDIHGTLAHISNRWSNNTEEYGRAAFGLPPGSPFFF